ncbi:MAG: hypothetical protein HGA31_05890 [Candidatus Moranbacteria bacterium]|nr:hypothetical protein [Candidatus Moranbacteria bacterium]
MRRALSFLVVSLMLSFFAVSPAEAQAASGFTVVAETAVYGGKIVRQNAGKLTMEFTLRNGGSTVQPDIRYGVEVLDASTSSTTPVDTQSFDETFSLKPGETVTKTVNYDIPESLQGVYRVQIVARTANGLLLGNTSIGTARFSGSGVILDAGKCYLTVNDAKTTYTLTQGVDIKEGETLSIHCPVRNPGSEKTVAPGYTTYERSSLGAKIGTTNAGQDLKIQRGDSDITLIVPTQTKPQAYETVLTMIENGKSVSADLSFHYVIQGKSATIQNIQTDKASYKSGETALVSLYLSGIAGSFDGSRTDAATLSNPTVSLVMRNGTGATCSAVVKKSLAELQNGKAATASIEVPVTVDCQDVVVSVTLADDSGVLAEHSAAVSANTVIERGKAGVNQIMRSGDKLRVIALFALIPILIFLVMLVRSSKGRGSKKGKSAKMFIFLLSAAIGGIALSGSVSAAKRGDAIVVGKTYAVDIPSFGTVSLAVSGLKSEYAPKEEMNIDWRAEVATCTNQDVQGQFKMGVDSAFTQCKSNASSSACTGMLKDLGAVIGTDADGEHFDEVQDGTYTQAAPLAAGQYYLGLWLRGTQHGKIFNTSFFQAESFKVVAPPVPVVSLGVDKDYLKNGESTRINWTVAGATECIASASPASATWTAKKSVTGGSESTGSLIQDTNFTLECRNANGDKSSDSVPVFVEKPASILTICTDDGTPFVSSLQPMKDMRIIQGRSVGLRAFSGTTEGCGGTDVTASIVAGNSGVVTLSSGNPKVLTGANIPNTAGRDSAQETVSATSDGQTASINVIVDENCVSRCAAAAATVCEGTPVEGVKDSCGVAEDDCDGTRSCNFNWKEVQPGV